MTRTAARCLPPSFPLREVLLGSTEVARVQAGPRTIARVRLLPAKALSGGADAFIPSLLEKGLNDPAFLKNAAQDDHTCPGVGRFL